MAAGNGSCAAPNLQPLPVVLLEVNERSLAQHLGELHLVYCAAFEGPPWREAARESDDFLFRLRTHAASPGFRCVLGFAPSNGRLLGFAYGLTTLDPARDRWAAPVAEALGSAQATRFLAGSFHFAELAVRPNARRQGVGGLLHDTALAGLPQRQAWLATSPLALEALALYRGRGWHSISTFLLAGSSAPRTVMIRELTASDR